MPPAVAGRPGASAPVTAKADSKPPVHRPIRWATWPRPRRRAPAAEPFSYFVQAGAFRTPEDAEAQRAKLSLMGLEAKVTEREQAGRTVFRVRVGPFDRKDDADKAKLRLDGRQHRVGPGAGAALSRTSVLLAGSSSTDRS